MYDFYLKCNGSNITLHYILTLCVCVCAKLYIQVGKGSIQLITVGGFGNLCVCLEVYCRLWYMQVQKCICCILFVHLS